MAKRFAPAPLPFAEGSYPAGSSAWSGQPRALVMTASEKAAGFTPNTPNAARNVNAELRELRDATAVDLHNAMKTWGLTMASDGANVMQSLGVIENGLSPATGEHWLLTAGNNFFDLHLSPDVAWTGQSNAGQAYINATHRTNVININPAQIVGGKGGAYIARVDAVDGKFYHGAVTTATLTTDNTFVSAGQTMKMVGYIGTGTTGNFITVFGVGTANGMAYSPNMGGGSWLTSTGLSTIAKAYELAQNPDGAVAVFSCKVGTTPQLFYSTDFGVTWTHGATMTASAQPGALCYSEALGLFFYLEDATGEIWASATGATWLVVASGAPRSVASGGSAGVNALQQDLGGQHRMAAAGPVLARIIERSDGTNAVKGVAYTTDLVNWNFSGLCNTALSLVLDMHSVDGRLIVAVGGSAEDALLMSGLLEAPAIDFT